MKFIKDSVRELKHVVWPTRLETKKFFVIVLTVLILFWFYLFVFSTIFSEGLLAIKNFVNPSVSQDYSIDLNSINLTEELENIVNTDETVVEDVVSSEVEAEVVEETPEVSNVEIAE